jgi:hypothetical protein
MVRVNTYKKETHDMKTGLQKQTVLQTVLDTETRRRRLKQWSSGDSGS